VCTSPAPDGSGRELRERANHEYADPWCFKRLFSALTKDSVARCAEECPDHSQRPGIPVEFQVMPGAVAFVEGLKCSGRNLTREGSIRDQDTGGYARLTFTKDDHTGGQEHSFLVRSRQGRDAGPERPYTLD